MPKRPIHRLTAALLLTCLALPLPMTAQTGPPGMLSPAQALAPRFVYVGNSAVSVGISAYTVDAITGALTPVPGTPSVLAGLFTPSLIANPTGRFVYATSYCGSLDITNCPTGSISAFSVDATSGALTPVPGSPYSSSGYFAQSLSVDPAGHFVYVTNECVSQTDCSSGTVAVFSVDATTGALTPVPGSPFASGGSGAFPVSSDPSGRFLYVVNKCVGFPGNCANGTVAVFSVNATTGALMQVPGSPFASDGQTPKSISIDPAGHFIYVANQCISPNDCSTGTVSVYAVDPNTHALTPAPGSPFGPVGGGAYSVSADPNVNLVYVLGGCADSSCVNGIVQAFSVDATTGALTPFGGSPVPSVGRVPMSMSFDLTGRFLYVTNECSTSTNCNIGGVAVFSVDAITNALTPVPGSPFLTGIFPDGVTTIDAAFDPNATLASLAIQPGAPAIPLGAAQQFTAVGTFSDGSTRFLTASATWSSSASAIATVSNMPGNSGLATGAAGGTTTITATVGATSASTTLTVNPAPPVLSTINPSSGQLGQVIATVTLTGTNLTGATINALNGITVSNVVATPSQVTATFTIVANAPLGAQNVSVTTSGGTSGNVVFTINPPPAPTLASVSPSSNVQGAIIGVTLTGTNFISGATINLSGSGITASGVSVVNSTTITATFTIATNAPLGTHNVSVTTSAGTSGTVTFTVNAAPGRPTLSAPPSPQVLTQGNSFLVTLTGTNFVPGNTAINITHSGLTVTNTTVLSSTSMTATFTIAANAAVGTANFTISTPAGKSNQRAVDVIGVPIINSISPANANPGSSVKVTLSGSQFLLAQIQFSGTGITATNREINDGFTKLTYTFTIASGATPGPQTVTLTNAAGTSNGMTFTVQ